MPTRDVGKTTQVDNWQFQQNYVERLMDNSAFTAAHPNNTLVLAGPARFPGTDNPGDSLLPVGMVQNMSVGQRRNVQQMQGIGSARSFFVAGKSSINFSIGRLLINGRNLLRAMYTQAVQNEIDVYEFDESPVRQERDEQFFLNLDSELFYIPVGLAVLFRSVAHDLVGAFYVEVCMFNSWNVRFQAGAAMIAESCQGVADRIRPIYPDTLFADTSADNPFQPQNRDSNPANEAMLPNQEWRPTPDLEGR